MTGRHLKAVPNPAPISARRALLYVRVSALMGRGGDDFHSPEMQLSANRRAIDLNGLAEVGVIDDDIDQTGRTFDREGIAKIKRLVEGGHVDVLVCYDIKRFGRNVYEGLGFAKWLDERGVRIVSASENIDTSTPAGRWMFTSLLAMAEFQSDEIGRYWSGVHERRAQLGHAHRAPFGYVKGDKDKPMMPHVVNGPAMTKVFERHAKGDRLIDIITDLRAETGVTARPETVKRQLRKRAYMGEIEFKGRILPGLHEPLVSQEVFDKVQARLALDAGTPPRQIECTWSMTGLVWCGACAGKSTIVRHGVCRRGIERLRCAEARRGRLKRCAGVGAPAKLEVEQEVLAQVSRYVSLLRGDLGAQTAAAARRASAAAEIPRLRTQRTKARSAISKLTKAWALGEVPDAAYRETLADLTEAEMAAGKALLLAESTVTDTRTPAQIMSAAEALLSMWDDMLEPERARALRMIIKRVVVRPVEQWREPVKDRVEVQFL